MSTEYFLPSDRTKRMPVARTYWGGKDRGCVVTFLGELADKQRLVSENGDRLTVAELRAMDGRGRVPPEAQP